MEIDKSVWPSWLLLAYKYLGTKEIPGVKTSKVIQLWLKFLGAWWNDDETPWCGVFVGYCLREQGHQPFLNPWVASEYNDATAGLLDTQRLQVGDERTKLGHAREWNVLIDESRWRRPEALLDSLLFLSGQLWRRHAHDDMRATEGRGRCRKPANW